MERNEEKMFCERVQIYKIFVKCALINTIKWNGLVVLIKLEWIQILFKILDEICDCVRFLEERKPGNFFSSAIFRQRALTCIWWSDKIVTYFMNFVNWHDINSSFNMLICVRKKRPGNVRMATRQNLREKAIIVKSYDDNIEKKSKLKIKRDMFVWWAFISLVSVAVTRKETWSHVK